MLTARDQSTNISSPVYIRNLEPKRTYGRRFTSLPAGRSADEALSTAMVLGNRCSCCWAIPVANPGGVPRWHNHQSVRVDILAELPGWAAPNSLYPSGAPLHVAIT